MYGPTNRGMFDPGNQTKIIDRFVAHIFYISTLVYTFLMTPFMQGEFCSQYCVCGGLCQ